MEAFLAQVAAAAGKASDQGYSKQGRPPVQPKSAAAGRPVKKEGVRQRSPSAPARNRARNSHEEPNTHKHKMLDWQAAPNRGIHYCSLYSHIQALTKPRHLHCFAPPEALSEPVTNRKTLPWRLCRLRWMRFGISCGLA